MSRKQVDNTRGKSSQSQQAGSRADKLNAIMKKLEDGVKDLFTSENYQKYLRTMSKFHRYSFNNTLLIALQRPDATLVAGYGAWQQKFHRQVKKGEKGITILAPVPVKAKTDQEAVTDHSGTSHHGGASHSGDTDHHNATDIRSRVNDHDTGTTHDDPGKQTLEKISLYFRPVSVFDVSQTEGEPLPSLGVDELTGTAEGYTAFMKALAALSPVPIRFDEIEGGAKGYYHTVDKEIVIKEGMSEAQTMKTCVHEVSHAILHDRDHMKAEGLQKDRQTKEVEAESCAFVVCSAFGLDTGDSYSFPYIGLWSGSREMKELKASMDTIRKTAGELIDGIEAELGKQMENVHEQASEKPSILAAIAKEKESLEAKRPSLKPDKAEMIADQPRFHHSGKELVM